MATMLVRQAGTGDPTFALSHSSPSDTFLTVFSVDLVDGNGLEVSGEPTTARFDLGDGYERVVRQVSDLNGRVRFTVEHPANPRSVTLNAGRETTPAFRPAPGAHLTIEL